MGSWIKGLMFVLVDLSICDICRFSQSQTFPNTTLTCVVTKQIKMPKCNNLSLSKRPPLNTVKGP